jgi:DNA polymerase III delta subunit
MAEWRVVVVTEVEALAGSKRAREFLVATAGKPPPGLALILVCTVPPRSSARFYRDLEKAARSVGFSAVSAADVPGWLMQWTRERHGREMEEEAARALAMGIGGDLAILARELEKLDAMVGEGDPISVEHVERGGTRIPRQDRWAWFDLVGERRIPEALEGLEILLDHGESGVGLTIGLATHLLRLGTAAAGGTRELESALPPHQRWLGRKLARQAGRWAPEELAEALEGLLMVDRLLKSSRLSERHHLETWLLGLAVEAGQGRTSVRA